MSIFDKFFPDPSVVKPRTKCKPTFSDRIGTGRIADMLDNDPSYNNEKDIEFERACNGTNSKPVVINLTINMPNGESTNSQIIVPASIEDADCK